MEIALHSEPDITDSNGVPYLATDTVHANGKRCAGRCEESTCRQPWSEPAVSVR